MHASKKKIKSPNFLKGLDTTFIVDENGKKWTLISHPKSKLQLAKIEDSDNLINSFVKYHYGLFNLMVIIHMIVLGIFQKPFIRIGYQWQSVSIGQAHKHKPV
jgi:hypothetical protein